MLLSSGLNPSCCFCRLSVDADEIKLLNEHFKGISASVEDDDVIDKTYVSFLMLLVSGKELGPPLMPHYAPLHTRIQIGSLRLP